MTEWLPLTSSLTKPRQLQERPLGYATLPYINGASDYMGHFLQKFQIQAYFRLIRKLAQIHVFKKPKD